jgi:hypothetical protein
VRPRHGPEYAIQKALVAYLEARGWLVERIVGMAFQMGLPDLFIAHPKWGQRWVEVKNPERYSFTKAQKIKWPLWEAKGVGIWIVTSADQEGYNRLFAPPNWRSFVRTSWKIPTLQDIDRMLDEMH